MKGKKEMWIGLAVLIILILAIVGLKMYNDNKVTTGGITQAQAKKMEKAKQVYVATGGGKENFIEDEEVTKIMLEKWAAKKDNKYGHEWKMISRGKRVWG